jgi:DNA-binding PadR family transcriptional regulator
MATDLELLMLRQLAQRGPIWIPGEASRVGAGMNAQITWSFMLEVLTKLEQKGLVEQAFTPLYIEPEYRITDAGRKALGEEKRIGL